MKDDVISKAIKKASENWDVEQMTQAIIADEPDAQGIAGEIKQALFDVKQGNYARSIKVTVSPIVEVRNKSGLSQRLFAERLGISVNTLKSWEQGKRQPSGSALALMKLITKKPELIAELA